MFLIRVLFLFIFSISIAAAAGGGGSSGGGDKDNAEWKLYNSQLSEIVKFINNKNYDMALS